MLESTGLKMLEAARLRRRLWWTIAAVVSLAASLIALLFPHLRQSLLLFAGAGLLLWVRNRFLPVPGLRTTPFSGLASLGGLLGGRGGAKRRRD